MSPAEEKEDYRILVTKQTNLACLTQIGIHWNDGSHAAEEGKGVEDDHDHAQLRPSPASGLSVRDAPDSKKPQGRTRTLLIIPVTWGPGFFMGPYLPWA